MRIKNVWSIVGLFLVVIMFFSTIAFSFIQSVRTPKAQETKLPETNIVNEELTSDVEILLLQNGRTIIKFVYNSTCADCQDVRFSLENLATQFPNQIIIENILKNEPTSITMSSYYGQRIVENVSGEEFLDALCELMVEPPVMCATRNV